MELKTGQAILKIEREPYDIATSQLQVAKALMQEEKKTERKFTIAAIGASAGGLYAIEAFSLNTPHDAGIAFVVIMHMDPHQKDLKPEIIQRYTAMKVLRLTDGMEVQPRVYVISPNKDMSILHGALLLLEPSRTRGLHLPIDFFFQRLAKDWREKAIYIVLSGMGSDGTIGLKIIKENFGMVMVQDVKLKVQVVSKSFSETFQLIPEQIRSHKLYHLGNGQWNIAELRRLTEEVFVTGKAFNNYLVEPSFPVIGYRKMLLNARLIHSPKAISRYYYWQFGILRKTRQVKENKSVTGSMV